MAAARVMVAPFQQQKTGAEAYTKFHRDCFATLAITATHSVVARSAATKQSRGTAVGRGRTGSEERSMNGLSQIVDQGEAERLATGFTFTEGPLYHPDGFYYFVDVRESKFYRIRPGSAAELLRENTGDGNGTTFDPQGRLVICEGGNRRLTRWPADGRFASSEVLIDRFEGKRLSRPNDVVCKSDGSIYFTNPGLRIPLSERELDPSAVYRVKPDGSASHICDVEYPNGLA